MSRVWCRKLCARFTDNVHMLQFVIGGFRNKSKFQKMLMTTWTTDIGRYIGCAHQDAFPIELQVRSGVRTKPIMPMIWKHNPTTRAHEFIVTNSYHQDSLAEWSKALA